MSKPEQRLAGLVPHLPGAILRTSQRGVPHIVYGEYSICFFGKSNSYRVFHPWPSFFKPQAKRDFKSHTEVIGYLKP